MTVFADSSALVKRYADEAHHELVRSIDEPTTVSALARVEIPSALWRKHRIGELTSDDAAALVAEFELDWYGDAELAPSFGAVKVTGSILESAALQVARYGLRAYDGMQLASALAARDVDPTTTWFAAFNTELRSAAGREGFGLIPPALP